MKGGVLYILLLLCLTGGSAIAQERVVPTDHNPMTGAPVRKAGLHKSTALSLPLFEDFTGYGPYPDGTMWVESQVYINNTMAVNPVSRGVATFDALNASGRPYDAVNQFALRYADSLTLLPLDLSALSPSDSVYLSFFYQPEGLGFPPEATDSMMLYFKKSNGTWVKAWSKEGNGNSGVPAFAQAMVRVADPDYFHAGFQFRFVNKASINTSDDHWHIDYIRMNSGRGYTDTAVNDVAFTTDPGYMLNDYTYMPYRHFLANANGERSTDIASSIRNGYSFAVNTNYFLTAVETESNTPLFSGGPAGANIPPYVAQGVSFPTYTNTTPIGSNVQSPVVFENKFYIESQSPTDNKNNDTIIRRQVFDNYLAYDDGTAEKAYNLNLYPSLPGKLAIEHHLNEPDVLQGVAIYFGRQVPMAGHKEFSIVVYKKLQGIEGAPNDELIYQQDFNYPQYLEINNFYTYKIDPVSLPAGQFYIGLIQPAMGVSDSLYYGLDMNRVQGNHAYFNIDGLWASSQVGGAIMVRPLVGQTVWDTGVESSLTKGSTLVSIYPNPATDHITCNYNGDKEAWYYILDMQGRTLLQGRLPADRKIKISALPPGMYMTRVASDSAISAPLKFVKQ